MDFVAEPFDQRVELHWSLPEEYVGCTVRRSQTSTPKTVEEGDFVYRGSSWKLTGIDSDRGLQNGVTYFYSLFPIDRQGRYKDPLTTSITPTPKAASPNLLFNPRFQEGLNGWKIEEPRGSYDLTSGHLRMYAQPSVDSTLSQRITNLKPKTLYTATMHAKSTSDKMAYTLSIDGDIQQKAQGFGPLTYHYIDKRLTGYWKVIRFVFWTDEKANPEVTFSIVGPKVAESSKSIFVEYDNLALQEGLLPMPKAALDPKHPLVKPLKPISLPKVGENLIRPHWQLSRATEKDGLIILSPGQDFAASATQLSPYYLRSGKHLLRAYAKVDPNTTALLSIEDGDYYQSIEVKSPDWTEIQIPIEGEWIHPLITYYVPKRQGFAYIKEMQLDATGEEWYPTKEPYPKMQLEPKVWDFTLQKFNPDELMVFSGFNSRPENLSFVDEGLRFTAYGQKRLEGAMILTREYFASGRYDIWLKIGPVYDEQGMIMHGQKPFGCSFPFFTFGYTSYMDGQPQWYDSPSPIRNSEIDIEIPADVPEDPKRCPPAIFWTNGRLNAYGGQRGGIHTNISMHEKTPDETDLADGAFHQLTIEWNSGEEKEDGTRKPGWIHWYVDGKLWGKLEGADYGFDNIPYRCCRIFTGAWFPTDGYGPSYCQDSGWAGTANWYRAEFIVKKIEYTPLKSMPTRDAWFPETDPDQVWNPKFYPK